MSLRNIAVPLQLGLQILLAGSGELYPMHNFELCNAIMNPQAPGMIYDIWLYVGYNYSHMRAFATLNLQVCALNLEAPRS